ncbi:MULTISPECIES: viperin family antiviral radical SAM protein [unclassified Fibrobacter]|uniref:S-adenosylmethionine-dependent nucleotide dehydratase n=1 Tax=Fibrobacter sp. (strain UWH6) TaxID=1896212 RepID=SAND_FIBS6|nr:MULTISPECIES: viperin family antiviral radical SAM protein [unclassified Fibrobacter]A0A1M7D0R2.1 RecName: Full=S-adenosylmethionine-dependent nucleotide dehydratase; Short=SAND; AltName: Full=Prokaryotic viperin protein pVip56; Short=pVip56 [Fibrobacter sp. UWH6]OWV04391.1 hypothetical protein B7993_11245 [Fibrobacter sp. UWH3]SHL73076.1 radical S-adenosyl methionine domain-containing protein 2 [Fibrobacter sp. UWH6]
MNIKTIVINWHITESCNYKCKYCFAKWNRVKEIWTNPDNVRKILENLKSIRLEDCLFTQKRLNIVGGEPILQQERLWQVIKMAHEMDFEISIITNGSHLEYICPFVHLISQVGVSIDSFDHKTNVRIGRECNGKTISFQQLKEKLEELRTLNPGLNIKINTVVNEYNFNEILVDRMAELKIDKWKILRQLPFDGKEGISDFKFNTFLFNNLKEEKMPKKDPLSNFLAAFSAPQKQNNVIFVEDNDVMTESYLMIAPDGRLFQNGHKEYEYSHPLTEISIDEALEEINFDQEKFNNRYENYATEEAKYRMEEFFLMNEYEDVSFDCCCPFGDKD